MTKAEEEAEKHTFVDDEKFDQMFKELENDADYLEELKKIEDSERHTMADKSKTKLRRSENEGHHIEKLGEQGFQGDY